MRKALYILAELDEADMRWLAETGDQRKIAEGETLIASGQTVEALYIVVDGELGVVMDSGQQVAKLAVGDIIGEMSLIERRPPIVSVSANTVSKVLAVPQHDLQQRLEEDTAFAARFYRALAVFLSDRLRDARLGYGGGDADGESSGLDDQAELDEGVLDTIHVAGDRMRRLLALLDGDGAKRRRSIKSP